MSPLRSRPWPEGTCRSVLTFSRSKEPKWSLYSPGGTRCLRLLSLPCSPTSSRESFPTQLLKALAWPSRGGRCESTSLIVISLMKNSSLFVTIRFPPTKVIPSRHEHGSCRFTPAITLSLSPAYRKVCIEASELHRRHGRPIAFYLEVTV